MNSYTVQILNTKDNNNMWSAYTTVECEGSNLSKLLDALHKETKATFRVRRGLSPTAERPEWIFDGFQLRKPA